ncbi:MAG: ABC transporter substrate-binding protein [Candidatus Heimdallarchaeota archaeon]
MAGVFEGQTGIKVDVVGVDENDIPETMAARVAANDLPDVIEISYDFVAGYTEQEILDPVTATAVIDELGRATFGEGALNMVTNVLGAGEAAVPLDGWVQGIWYRKDLFDANGLNPPDSWVNIEAAAKALHNPPSMYGIVIGTHPRRVYTQQVYEHFALANGARAFDSAGNLIIDTPRQVEAIQFYADLAAYAPPGYNDWKEANQLYLTGAAAMMFYSTYIIDDILGLQARDWTPIEGLGEKTAFAPVMEGAHGDKGTYGQLNTMAICKDAVAGTKDWVKYVLGDGYFDWVNMALVGKMPVRTTIQAEWKNNEMFQQYSEGFGDQIISGFNAIDRWGLVEGKVFPAVADIYGELVVPEAISDVIAGRMTAAQAATWAQERMEYVLGERDTPPYKPVAPETVVKTSVITETVAEMDPKLGLLFMLAAAFYIPLMIRKRNK